MYDKLIQFAIKNNNFIRHSENTPQNGNFYFYSGYVNFSFSYKIKFHLFIACITALTGIFKNRNFTISFKTIVFEYCIGNKNRPTVNRIQISGNQTTVTD